jgi:hypothetical protein
VQEAVKNRQDKKANVQVILRAGTYELHETLTFRREDGGDSVNTVEYLSYPGEKVSISGGRALGGVWQKTDNENIWKLRIAGFSKNRDIFRSLFMNEKQLKRASSDTLFSKGPIPQYASSYKVFDFPAIRRLAKDSIEVFCGFVYDGNELEDIQDLSGAEVIVYNSWEASWHSVRQVDPTNKIISFRNPATYPVGFFNPRVRFRIENVKHYLDEPGEWILDYTTGEVFYFASKQEDPNSQRFTIPKLQKLITIDGGTETDNPVQNLKFTGINFTCTSSAWGINSIPSSFKEKGKRRLDWIDFNEGFSSIQAALDCGEAILLKNSVNISFNKCSFNNLGNYAVRIGEYSKNNIISNCKITNVGGGGVIIGFNKLGGKEKKFPENMSPAFNRIENCDISNCGIVFPSGVGIGIMQANHSIIKSNTIHDLPYSGISVGWSFSASESYTTHNTILDNYIHDVMKTLADGGGIYTIGRQTGSVYRNNFIENVRRSANAIGSSNNGFFFDEGSSDFLVEANVVENIQNKDYRFNKSDQTKIRMLKNHFQKEGANKGLREEVKTKWTNRSKQNNNSEQ